MAPEIIRLVLSTPNPSHLFRIEKTLRRVFPHHDHLFEVQSANWTAEEWDTAKAIVYKHYVSGLPRMFTDPTFTFLEDRSRCTLELCGADAVLTVETTYACPHSGSSAFDTRALLLERTRRDMDTLRPYFARFTMPFLGSSGSTREQTEYGEKQVINGVLRGWAAGARHGSVLSSIPDRYPEAKL